MNQTVHDAFVRELDAAGRLDVDVAALVDRGETRLRQRRLAALAGCVAAVILVVAAAVTMMAGPTTKGGHGPVDHPRHPAPSRKIVYADHKEGLVPGHTVHFGGRVVETGDNHVHLDVTDDGFLYTDHTRLGGVWFSDGSAPVRVATHVCGASPNSANFLTRAVVTANSGSLAAWLDCTKPSRLALVVFDSSSRRVLARQPLPAPPSCFGYACGLLDVTSNAVYLAWRGGPGPDYRYDVETYRLRATTPKEYREDLRNRPRGLVLGENWQSGTPLDPDGRLAAGRVLLEFDVVGSRLVPVVSEDSDHEHTTSAFNTATRRALHLRLPDGYHHTDVGFRVFEWLDDDTIALVGGGDILTCSSSTGRCVLAVPRPPHGMVRLLPTFPLPG